MKRYLLIFLLFFHLPAPAQDKIDTAAIIRLLDTIYQNDQMPRKHNASYTEMQRKDSVNQVLVEQLISKYGWMGKSFVGEDGNMALFLVIQHADLAMQEKYLPMMERSVAIGESRLIDLALLQDRVLMRQGKKQIYGSQIVRDEKTGGWMVYPIEDEQHVNARRAKAGLQPLEEYARIFGVEWAPPKE